MENRNPNRLRHPHHLFKPQALNCFQPRTSICLWMKITWGCLASRSQLRTKACCRNNRRNLTGNKKRAKLVLLAKNPDKRQKDLTMRSLPSSLFIHLVCLQLPIKSKRLLILKWVLNKHKRIPCLKPTRTLCLINMKIRNSTWLISC